MFKEELQRLVQHTPGAVAACVMGYDGIPIDSHDGEHADGSEQAALVELGNLAAQARSAAEATGTPGVDDITLTTSRFTALMRPLTPEYVLGLVVRPGGLVGKGRYLMRVSAQNIAAQLS
jgi:predicted regulator of Ras-like GTPase activity (Roadblock/LC7/MglB family)